ncbi:MAG TPA: DUF2231 domain-containing protein [Miltoncostaeaceae bacterium]|nr:DUF2231 domain-containing protein [Miltoncostaeaceae bacterium]
MDADAAGTAHRPTPGPLAALVERIEDDARLDAPADAVARALEPVLAHDGLRSALRGEWLGHAVHPLMTDVPIGTWLSAILLDAAGGPRARPAATALVGVGVAAAVPTALTGLAEWQATTGRARRVGLVHAAANVAGVLMFVVSLVARLFGRHRGGARAALLGGAALSAGGYLGGHLSIAQKVGTADPRWLERTGAHVGEQDPTA